jgi:hypothetical protein
VIRPPDRQSALFADDGQSGSDFKPALPDQYQFWVIYVVRSLDKELDQAAIRAVRQWTFDPGTKDGHPVPVPMNLEFALNLG